MTKEQQKYFNEQAHILWIHALAEYEKESDTRKKFKLRSCDAVVYETTHFYLLQSYRTLISAIDKRNYEITDMLRFVYHYTNTSNMHISKFIHDYTPFPWNSNKFVWRPIKSK